MEGTLTAPPKTPEMSPEEKEWAAIKDFTVKEVEADVSGNPNEKYSPGRLEDSDASYIDKVTAEVDRRMADPNYIAEVKAHLTDINRPDRRWN